LAVFRDKLKFETLYATEQETTKALKDKFKLHEKIVQEAWILNEENWTKRLTDSENVSKVCAKALKASERSRKGSFIKGAGGGLLVALGIILLAK